MLTTGLGSSVSSGGILPCQDSKTLPHFLLRSGSSWWPHETYAQLQPQYTNIFVWGISDATTLEALFLNLGDVFGSRYHTIIAPKKLGKPYFFFILTHCAQQFLFCGYVMKRASRLSPPAFSCQRSQSRKVLSASGSISFDKKVIRKLLFRSLQKF